jgi:tetratricopeptide (TPR) repeat protein
MHETEQQILERLLGQVRRRLFIRTAGGTALRAALWFWPLAAVLVAADQRWGGGSASWLIALAAVAGVIAFAIYKGLTTLGEKVQSALVLDNRADLKDRISSACEFLEEGHLDEARQVQVRDAVRRARQVNAKAVLRFEWPRWSALMPVAALALLVSFLVPPLRVPQPAFASDPVRQAQIEQLAELQQELQAKQETEPELEEVLKKLESIKKQFEQGELSERDLMLELSRLDENLRSKVKELGVENLEGEMNVIVPHLMSSAATLQAAEALKEGQLDKAAEELDQLAEKFKQKQISKEQQKELTMAMGVCASKLGNKTAASFGGDFSKASESLEKSDCDGFGSACKSVGNKLALMKKARAMKSACKGLGNCKMALGQCNSTELGYKLGLKQPGKNKGGLKAGTAASGDPFGEPNRLEDSYKQMVRISGEAGEGPVESETEITEGQMSASQISVKDLHATFAAAAEEVIEKEDIPLSHRYHVKRYFQSIRPQE